jgi:hypothetical protein
LVAVIGKFHHDFDDTRSPQRRCAV